MVEVKIIRETPSSYIVQGTRVDRKVVYPANKGSCSVFACERVSKSKAVDVETITENKKEIPVSCKIPQWLYDQIMIDAPDPIKSE